MTAPAPAPVAMRSPAEFRKLRDFLNGRGFTEEAICERYSLGVINDFRALVDGREPEEIRDALGVLARLFLDSVPVSESVVREHLSGEEIDLLSSFGLLTRDASVPDAVRGTVLLYPVRSLFVISDSFHNPEIKNSPEIVYPVITANTHRFLALIPDTSCESFLELCGGTGIAALCAAEWRSALGIDGHYRAGDVFRGVQRTSEQVVPIFRTSRRSVRARCRTNISTHRVPSALCRGAEAGIHLSRWRRGWRADHAASFPGCRKIPGDRWASVLHCCD